jgi:hypothetical protein
MQTLSKIVLTSLATIFLSLLSAHATDLFWGAGGAVSPNNSWATAGNWYTEAGELTASLATPSLSDDLFFNTTPDNALGGTVAMSANFPFFARSMTFNTAATMNFD